MGFRRGNGSGAQVFRTAKILRLEYGKLKRMMESAGPVARRAAPPAAFLELLPSQAVGLAECLIESPTCCAKVGKQVIYGTNWQDALHPVVEWLNFKLISKVPGTRAPA